MLDGLLSSYNINGHDTEEACQFSETGKLQKKAFSIMYPAAKGWEHLTCG
jgi:hypothetical protein